MAIKYTEEQLNSVDKSMLIQMFLNQQEQLEKVSANLHSLDTKMQAMMEQLILGNKNRFGRSSEKMEDTQQMRFIEVDGTLVFFNEAEAVCDLDAPEPETLEAAPERKKKSKGKKAQDMSELSTNRIDHYMTEEELTAEFGENGWKQQSRQRHGGQTGRVLHAAQNHRGRAAALPEALQGKDRPLQLRRPIRVEFLQVLCPQLQQARPQEAHSYVLCGFVHNRYPALPLRQ